MKRLLLLTIVAGALYALVNGCAVEEVTPPRSVSAQPAFIATASSGSQAASEVMQTADLFYNSAMLWKALGSHTINVMNSDPTVTLTAPIGCADYGEFSYAGTVNASGNYTLTLTYKLCREDGYQYDGVMNVQGTPDNLSATLGNSGDFRIIDFDSDRYEAIIGIISVPQLTFTMSGSAGAASESYTIQPTGSITAFDYISLGQFTVIFNGVQLSFGRSTLPTSRTTTVTMNGSARETWPGGYMVLALSNYSVTKTEAVSSAGPPPTYSGSDTIVAGTVTYDYSIGSNGLPGIITVSTLTPVHHTYSTGKTSAGTVVCTGTGAATIQYNAGGTIDVTVAGGAPVTLSSEYFLNKVVTMYGMEQATPQFMGAGGVAASAKASGSSWNATMTVTALSSGSNLSCYTDVHVNYYDLAAPATIAWYVDWHIDLVNNCSRPAGIPFQEARDVNGNSVCDAGLDINGADVDLSSGGVEHFTATDLPQGYYVVSINNWSCGTDISNQASIIIGDYLFGTYNCTYSTSDGDGTNPGAWCRLADIQVNADGSANVLTPNSAYTPWHN